MMHSLSLHRGFYWHPKIDDIRNRLQRRIDNARTAGGADNELGAISIQNYGRRHAAQWPFLRLERVGLVTDQSVNISDVRMDGKIIHFVVEHDSRARHK